MLHSQCSYISTRHLEGRSLHRFSSIKIPRNTTKTSPRQIWVSIGRFVTYLLLRFALGSAYPIASGSDAASDAAHQQGLERRLLLHWHDLPLTFYQSRATCLLWRWLTRGFLEMAHSYKNTCVCFSINAKNCHSNGRCSTVFLRSGRTF